ncbi:MAG: hypothetical protein R3D80_14195 [Paracoccaceae bacterium]
MPFVVAELLRPFAVHHVVEFGDQVLEAPLTSRSPSAATAAR